MTICTTVTANRKLGIRTIAPKAVDGWSCKTVTLPTGPVSERPTPRIIHLTWMVLQLPMGGSRSQSSRIRCWPCNRMWRGYRIPIQSSRKGLTLTCLHLLWAQPAPNLIREIGLILQSHQGLKMERTTQFEFGLCSRANWETSKNSSNFPIISDDTMRYFIKDLDAYSLLSITTFLIIDRLHAGRRWMSWVRNLEIAMRVWRVEA